MGNIYVHVLEGVPKEVQPLPKSWGNCSGGFNKKTDIELKEYNWLPREEVVIPYDNVTHYRGPPSVDVQEDKVVYTDNVIAFTAQELKQNKWNDWISDMNATDRESKGMSRNSEDIIDMLVTKYPNILSEFDSRDEGIAGKHKAKKELRATKPTNPNE